MENKHKFSIESAGGPNINYDFMNSDDNVSNENEPNSSNDNITDYKRFSFDSGYGTNSNTTFRNNRKKQKMEDYIPE